MGNFSILNKKYGALKIDNYTKDGGPGKSDFYVVFAMSLSAFEIKQTLIILLFEVARLWNYVYRLQELVKADLWIWASYITKY